MAIDLSNKTKQQRTAAIAAKFAELLGELEHNARDEGLIRKDESLNLALGRAAPRVVFDPKPLDADKAREFITTIIDAGSQYKLGHSAIENLMFLQKYVDRPASWWYEPGKDKRVFVRRYVNVRLQKVLSKAGIKARTEIVPSRLAVIKPDEIGLKISLGRVE